MAKKQPQRKISVKSPKIGKDYFFRFAGSILKGTILSECDKLTELYKEKYYTIESGQNQITPGSVTRYPVSIRQIALTYNELKSNNV